MAPKRKSAAASASPADIKASLLGQATPQPKGAGGKKATADTTPSNPEPATAKRRKVDDAAGDKASDSVWIENAAGTSSDLASPTFQPSSIASQHPIGKPIGFDLVASVLQSVENLVGSGAGSRKKCTILLTNMLRTILYSNPKDLIPVIYILSNKVAPDYEEAQLGVGDGLVIKAMCESFGKQAKDINHTMAAGDAKDLGEVALLSRNAQKVLMLPPKLTIERVFSEMIAIANDKGKNSQTTKKDRMKKMLVASRGVEAKYIVRMLQAKLRVGIQVPTLMQAIASAFILSPPIKDAPKDSPCAMSDLRKTKSVDLAKVEERITAMEAAVKQAYSEMPNFDKVIGALMEGKDETNLAETCHISLGIPVKPMLAKPSKGIREVAERLTGKRFTGEWKYDGERAQIHVVDRENIFVYSRNSENMTEKYPDVIKVVKECLSETVQSCIIDSELVAFDQTSKKILPFQILSTRGRKNIDIDSIKVNVCLYPFDCMLCNGTPLVTETLETRRKSLWSCLKELEGKVKFAEYRNFDDLVEDDIQAFLNESIEGSCEGLMLKTLVDNASYAPSQRSLNWLKLKKDYLEGLGDSLDVVPIGAYYGKGKRTGSFGAYLLAIYDPENEEYQTICRTGTGFSDEDLQTHHSFFKEKTLQNREFNYNVNDKMVPDVWFEACQVWEIKAADLSISPVHTAALGMKASGKGIALRFPRFLRIRDDKPPEESSGPDQICDMFESQASVGKTEMDDDDM